MDNTFTQEQKDNIVEMYLNNQNVDEIIKSYNCDEHYIREVLKERQVDRIYNYFSEELENRVASQYKNGLLHKDITYQLLVSSNGINRIAKRHGIPRQTYTHRNRKFNRNSNYFDVIDTPNKAYFLGLLSSDGCNFPEHSQITISLSEEDGYLLEKLKEELEYEGPVRKNETAHRKNPKHKVASILAIEDIHMSKRLEELGVIKNKSLTYKFPDAIPPELMRHFLRGYFDGDGSALYDSKRKIGSAQIVGTYDFCIHLRDILSKRGIYSGMRNPKQSKGKNTYIISTSGTNTSYSFLSWLYEDCEIKMVRKYANYLKIRERYYQQHHTYETLQSNDL